MEMSTQPPPPPPPPPLPPSPPPLPPPAVAPFHHKIPSGGLRTGLKPIGGILLGGALQGGSAVLVSFADRRKTKPTAQDLRGLGLMKAMRSLDSLRKHVVAEEEAETLGVSSGRIDVQSLEGSMTLCGCMRGSRVTHEEMKIIHRVTRGMTETFVRSELLFQTLAPKMRDASIGEEEKHGGVDVFFEAAETWLGFYDELHAFAAEKMVEMELSVEVRAETKLFLAGSCEPNLLVSSGGATKPTFTQHPLTPHCRRCQLDSEQNRLNDPTANCGDGCSSSSNSSSSSLLPEAGLDPPPPTSNTHDGNEPPSADDEEHDLQNALELPISPENIMAAKNALEEGGTSSCESFVTTTEEGGGKGIGAADFCISISAVDSLAKFSRFLALLVATSEEEQAPYTTRRETREALAELLRASDDGSDRRETGSVLPSPVKTNREAEEKTLFGGLSLSSSLIWPQAATRGRPLRYWVLRIHRFLSSLQELKTVSDRDVKSLERVKPRLG